MGGAARIDRRPAGASTSRRDRRRGHAAFTCRWSESSPPRSTSPTRADRRLHVVPAAARRAATRLPLQRRAVPLASAQLAVEPRPYQLVPLLMALRQDPVRLLIADDVGIGKTVEAALIARELLDQGEARRLAVLCPPAPRRAVAGRAAHQVQHRGRAAPAQHRHAGSSGDLAWARSLFDVYPYTHRLHRLHQDPTGAATTSCAPAPELVIVDEAHTCASRGAAAGPGATYGYQLLHEPRRRPGPPPDPGHRHPAQRQGGGVPVAARPAQARVRRPARRSRPDTTRTRPTQARPTFRAAPPRRHPPLPRRRHTVPRPSATSEATVQALAASTSDSSTECSPLPARPSGRRGRCPHRQRVRWWSALALLRSMASSPAAAAATLRSRAAAASRRPPEEADELGRRSVLDLRKTTRAERLDVTPGADPTEPDAPDEDESLQRRLLALAREADQLYAGEPDEKLAKAIKLVKELLADGYRPDRLLPVHPDGRLSRRAPRRRHSAARHGSRR